MVHDRIHAREPTHDRDRWTEGVVESVAERDGHWVVRARPAENGREGDDSVELVVTLAVRDLFLSRLDIDAGESPVGCRFWYRKKRR
ncbi:hypothetical protein DEQ92_07450 [Haloferax sp. Atlit-6N]|uniref:Uncharacterized protein n=2 Tax=Haloferax TaxID=2251 RepID=M0I2R8_9EURY|nr:MULTISPECIES: hypothetical protein [Haloferax]ELZ83885.1 hypothetical protein C454_06227 [Haloferax gibbonsii ATCC 33959]ELZ90252.1 hypothetical protein C441_13270 [Haloferax sulfurifontis ATCC BAA-897]RDZ54262.1 hypothetical protein C5C07_01630 [Haloferax sp. Atlit-4N]REA06082.1 hypothetical protein DEQ92_07450 [Haloferax sp. Atlit-6N]